MTLTTGRSADPRRGECHGHVPLRARVDCGTGSQQQTEAVRGTARGFTLLELVLVMMLVSLVMALAAPSLHGFLVGRKSADAASQMVALGQYARTQAISTGCNYRLNVDVAERTYWLTVQKGVDYQDLGTEFGRRFSLPDGVEASWLPSPYVGREYLEFLPDGRTEAVSLALTGKDGSYFEIGCRSETEMLMVLQRGGR